jgi:retinol dehydrogenase-12
LTSLASVKNAAKVFKERSGEKGRLDILMLNAGIMATAPGLTKDGYEIQYGTNHVGHAAFTKLLMPVLLRTAEQQSSEVRVVVLASEGHKVVPRGGIVFGELKTTMPKCNTWIRYGQAKLANVLYAKELNRRYESRGLKVMAVHPGMVSTGLTRGVREGWPFWDIPVQIGNWLVGGPVAKGSKNQLWAATAKEVKGGVYYTPMGREMPGGRWARDESLQQKLWEWTETELKGNGFGDEDEV